MDSRSPAGAARDDGPPTVPSDWGALRAAPARPEPTSHALEFSASGSEYFRIWIVNLLLTLVTFGLYYPWAKVRKLRYFYGNTRLAGHAFDFHGDPKRMLRGYLLVGALFLLYGFAGQVSPVAGVIALVILAAVWPALLAASMRFRLAQTSWRGLRFQFTGDVAGAYRALLPAFVAAVVMVAVSVAVVPDAQAVTPGGRPKPPSGFAIFMLVVSMAALAAVMPLTLWLLKRYQHDNYQFAAVRVRFAAGPGPFYRLALKTGGLFALVLLAAGLLAGAIMIGGGPPSAGRMALIVLLPLLGYAAALFALQPYLVSRLQNLVWSRTESRSVGFASRLRFWPLARLTLVNFFLIVVTLGLYWPFAAVATARLRLQSVSVQARGDLDALAARPGGGTQDASGDAAADLFGIDLGL